MYTLAAIFMMSFGILSAQVAQISSKPLPVTKKKTVLNQQSFKNNLKSSNRSEKHLASIIWSDDFSNPSNWVMTNEASNSDNWIITNQVPVSQFALPIINSTSAANGFAIFDSDSLCSGNEIGDMTNATAISCTGHPLVQLSFQEFYERFYDSTFILVSNDNINWVKYSVNTPLQNEDFCSSNPDTVLINISATAGNQATVWIRFQFYSPSAVFGTSAGCGYSWMIDDIAITDLDSNDIKLQNVAFGYTQIPAGEQSPLTMAADINNIGAVAQSSVVLSVSVNISAFNGTSSAFSSMISNAMDTLYISNTYTPGAAGNYTFDFSVQQSQTDGNTANNSGSGTLMINDSIYSRDDNFFSGLLNPINNGMGSTTFLPFETGNIFFINSPCDASSVTFVIDPGYSDTGSVDVKIYSVDTTGGYAFTQVGSTSNIYNIQPTDFPGNTGPNPQSITIPFTPRIHLTHGFFLTTVEYIADTVPVAIVASQDYLVLPNTSWFYDGNLGAWSDLDRVPLVRLNLNNIVGGINEVSSSNGIKLFQNEPNPYNSTSIIGYELPNDAHVLLNITDLLGANVMTIDEGNKSAGIHNVTIGNVLSKGIYFYTLKVGETTITRKMVVSE